MLIYSDVGVQTSLNIIENIKIRPEKENFLNLEDIQGILKEEVYLLLQEKEIPSKGPSKVPYVIMIVGVNVGWENYNHWKISL